MRRGKPARVRALSDYQGDSRADTFKILARHFIKALENWDQRYHLIVASGVLYHLKNPLHLVELTAKRTDAVYFWTHVVTEESMPPSDPRRLVIASDFENHSFRGINVRAYRRTYASAQTDVTFCGGLSDEHRWLHRDDLLSAFKAVGFNGIRTACRASR
jgi:hypothetical protein